MIFGAAYYPEHREPSMWEFDLSMMKTAGINAVRVGEFAWKRFEPLSNMYDFSWMDSFVEKARAYGIRVLMCPPVRTAPSWLVEQDPTILITTRESVRLEFASRYTFCINHPLLRERAMSLADALAHHYGSHDTILGWHLDNEYGDDPDCHCPICREKFQKWLERRYTTIHNLNFTWGTVFWGLEFDSFGQIPTPGPTKASLHPAHLQAWRQFVSDCTVELAGLHAQTVRSRIASASSQYITTNNQALWNNRTDYYDLARHLDIVGTNYYPPYGESYRDSAFALATSRSFKNKNFEIHELRSGPHTIAGKEANAVAPGEITRLTLHALAHGADAIYYFRWRACPFGPEQNHGAITNPDGSANRIYDEIASIGKRMAEIGPLLDNSVVKSDIAILYDFPTRWMTETGAEWEGPRDLYVATCKKIYAQVRACGYCCDAVGRDDDFGRYKIVVVPMLSGLDDALATKFVSFVHDGGVLVWHPLSGQRNRDACIYPGRHHESIQNLLGVTIPDITTSPSDAPISFVWNKQSYEGALYFELVKPNMAARVLAKYENCWFDNYGAILENKQGKGKVVYITCFPKPPFYRDFLLNLAKSCKIDPILSGEIPDSVEIAERISPDNKRMIFLLNAKQSDITVKLAKPMFDMWDNRMTGQRVRLAPYGVSMLVRIS